MVDKSTRCAAVLWVSYQSQWFFFPSLVIVVNLTKKKKVIVVKNLFIYFVESGQKIHSDKTTRRLFRAIGIFSLK